MNFQRRWSWCSKKKQYRPRVLYSFEYAFKGFLVTYFCIIFLLGVITSFLYPPNTILFWLFAFMIIKYRDKLEKLFKSLEKM